MMDWAAGPGISPTLAWALASEASKRSMAARKCLSLNPSNGNACYNSSVIYNAQNDFVKAYQYALKAKSVNYPVDAGYLDRLKNLTK